MKDRGHYVCLDFVHHQKLDLIVIVRAGKDILLLRSLATTLEDVGPKVSTRLLKGKARPPQVLESLIFLICWLVRGLVIPRQEHGWVGNIIWMRVLLGWWHTNDRQVK